MAKAQSNIMSQSTDIALLQQINTSAILKVLRNAGEKPLSRVVIGSETGLSPATVTKVVKKLHKLGIIQEIGSAKSSGGRRASLLKFDPTAFCIIALDYSSKTVALADLDANIINSLKIDFTDTKSPKNTLEKLAIKITKLMKDAKIPKKKIIGVGMSLPGVIDFAEGFLVASNELGWYDVPVQDIMEKTLRLPTLLENDVRSRLYGEYLLGAGREFNNIVCLDCSEGGIGSAAILEGRLFRGASNTMGEIGHIPIVPRGPVCKCGNSGCLEVYASGQAFLDDTVLWKNFSEVIHAAIRGDRIARNIYKRWVKYLVMAVIILGVTFDPEIIVLSGELIEVGGEKLVNTIMNEACSKIKYSNVKIAKSNLGNRAGIVGACSMVYEHAFHLPILLR